MTYKIYISTQDDEGQQFRQTVQTSLFNLNEFPVTAISADDAVGTAYMEQVRALLRGSQIFIGVYGDAYGDVPAGATQSYAEQAYHIAHELGLMCLIYMPESARTPQDERQARFKEHLESNHVIHYFDTLDELSALVVMGVGKYRMTHKQRRLVPPIQSFRPPSPPAEVADEDDDAFIDVPPPPQAPAPVARSARFEDIDDTLEESIEEADLLPDFEAQTVAPERLATLVNQAFDIARDDIEQLMRRALEVHDAQSMIRERTEDVAQKMGWMQVNPIFGEPLKGAQFDADIFMIMPFRDHFDSIYRNLIIPTVAELNFTMKRGDDFTSTSGSIMREVWAAINACRLVIVETTEVNANVFYELGIAHTLGKPAVLLTQHTDADDLPFDLRHLRFIIYEDSIEGGEKLEADLKKTILNIVNDLEDGVD
jgi:hypothetical protein